VSNHSRMQAAVRALTSTELTWEGDWHALFDDQGIDAGPFNGRMLDFINQVMSASYTSLPEAQQAYAEALGYNNWSALDTVNLTP
jgi:hypothetical protein